jgi:L-ascorbate metabolism protein UlaG (beta-lactamase superfamily)
MKRIEFGKLPSGDRLNRILKSPNYKNGAFQNIEPTVLNPSKLAIFKVIKDFYNKPKTVIPSREIPYVKTDLELKNTDRPTIVWFGHSSYLITSKGFTILVDPVLSGNISPIKLFGCSFLGSDHYKAENFPEIDLLIITHDHYDHLDYKAIVRLKSRIKKVVTPLGVGAHLEYWGIDKNRIIELDWWEESLIQNDIEVTATPARHFSGRSFTRAQSLWASFVVKLHGYKLFIGGDSGYDSQFKVIGEKFEGFDLVFLECGQYGINWPHIHMTPEETAQAAQDLRANILFPVHWSKFSLSVHAWNEPIKKLVVAAKNKKQQLVTPQIGQAYTIGEELYQKEWWSFD